MPDHSFDRTHFQPSVHERELQMTKVVTCLIMTAALMVIFSCSAGPAGESGSDANMAMGPQKHDSVVTAGGEPVGSQSSGCHHGFACRRRNCLSNVLIGRRRKHLSEHWGRNDWRKWSSERSCCGNRIRRRSSQTRICHEPNKGLTIPRSRSRTILPAYSGRTALR